MNDALTDDLMDFIQKKIANGQYSSAEAVIEAALKRFRDQEDETRNTVLGLDDLIDREFVEYCEREADESVTLDEVLHTTSTIKDSMARVIIEEERAERF
jgi:putative addiction module CopG family antidote